MTYTVLGSSFPDSNGRKRTEADETAKLEIEVTEVSVFSSSLPT